MTDLRKAAEMALEALNQATGMCAKRTSTRRDIDEAIQALRQALAQPEQEPVCTKIEGNQFDTFKVRYEDAVKLKDLPVGTKLYTAPPQREWVGLTDEEIAEGAKQSWVDKQAFESAVWWAEEKLREKNRG